jgi:hypothetical protein
MQFHFASAPSLERVIIAFDFYEAELVQDARQTAGASAEACVRNPEPNVF